MDNEVIKNILARLRALEMLAVLMMRDSPAADQLNQMLKIQVEGLTTAGLFSESNTGAAEDIAKALESLRGQAFGRT